MYLYGKMYDKAMAQTQAGIKKKQHLYDAADALDVHWGDRSLKSLYDWHKKRDPSRQKRQMKTRDGGGGGDGSGSGDGDGS